MTFEKALDFIMTTEFENFSVVDGNFLFTKTGKSWVILYSNEPFHPTVDLAYNTNDDTEADWSVHFDEDQELYAIVDEMFYSCEEKMTGEGVVDFTLKYGSLPFDCLTKYFKKKELFWKVKK
jgi:hypothetical protein